MSGQIMIRRSQCSFFFAD